jgi:hypothetical protein
MKLAESIFQVRMLWKNSDVTNWVNCSDQYPKKKNMRWDFLKYVEKLLRRVCEYWIKNSD